MRVMLAPGEVMIKQFFKFYIVATISVFPCQILASDKSDDGRENFLIDAFVGLGVDSFAATDVNEYLNPDELGDTKERLTAGFEFSYRLKGEKGNSNQLWVYGRTIHGVRSTDIDCKENSKLSICEDFSTELSNPTERGLYVLRNASSLEALIGLRWEFGSPQNAARTYINGQLGFVAVTDDDDDVADVSHLGIGGTLTNGDYQGSFLELGYGRNDLLTEQKYKRVKINARVVKRFKGKGIIEGLFAQISTDVDFGDGVDSVQTYLGLLFKLPDPKQ